VFANGSRRVQRGVAKCKAPRGEASRLVPVLVPRRCDDHFIPFIPSSIITRSNAAQAPTYITVVEGLGLSPYDLLVGAQILKQVYTACFGLHESACTVILCTTVLLYISYYHTVLYVRIDRCGGTVFDGVRYKCETCDDFDLCARCQDMHRKPGKIERLPVSYIHHMYGTYANKFFLSLQKALKLRSRPLEL